MIKLYHIKSIAQQTDNCMSVWFTVKKSFDEQQKRIPRCITQNYQMSFWLPGFCSASILKEVTDLSIEAMICK